MRRLLAAPRLLGLVLAVFFFSESLAPSLLAREWYFQGVISGVSVAVGYGLGALLTSLGGWLRTRLGWGWAPFQDETDHRVRAGLFAVAIAYGTWASARAVADHVWTWERLDYDGFDRRNAFAGILLLTVVVAGLLLGIAWLLRWVWHHTTRVGARLVPAWIAGSLAFLLIGWVLLASANNFVLQRTLDGLNAAFRAGDLDLEDAPPPPTSWRRSAGPASDVAWAEVGAYGRWFLVEGPDAAELAEVVPGPVIEPIRVFVGRASADTLDKRVELALDELEHLGAFDRSAILMVIPTGKGWNNEQIIQPMEYFHGGDVATVSLQYSHLPSPLAFVAEGHTAGDAGTALLDGILDRLSESEGDGPKLYIAGESLGSYGGSEAFSSLADSREKVDGALWVGSPSMNELRREAERVRRPGSPMIKPVVGDGSDFVFANRAEDLVGTNPHSVFLQQADDPIVWWDVETLWSRPDWLTEPLDPAVNPAMRWTPVTTFLQLVADMAVSNAFSEYHGHKYGTLPLDAWRAILQPEDWSPARIEQLRERLEEVPRDPLEEMDALAR